MSWVMGVLLGGLIGTILLIAIPRSMGGGAEPTPAAAAPAATAGTASAGAGASGEVAPGTTSTASEASTAAEGAPAVQTEASGSAGTPTAADGDAEAGKAKFAGSCAACHGANAEGGMGGLAPSMANVKGWTPEQFTAAVRELKAPEKELKAPMMKFGPDQVSDADVANMYAYLHSLN